MEEVCVKCGKPQNLKTDERIVRCPYCKDFFKPLAELIVLHEEKLNHLVSIRPGRMFFTYPLLKRVLLLLFIIFALVPELWIRSTGIAGILVLLAYNRYMLKHSISLKIQQLEESVEELNREYQKLYPESD